MSSQQLVLVTGVSGFIGAHVAVCLVNEGYRVRGTVRSMEKANKLIHLNPELEGKIEFVIVTDIVDLPALKGAVKGCDYICHVASPVLVDVHDNKTELLDPAVNGTLRVLEAATSEPKVKRVVITSSFVALRNFSTDPNVGYNYTEKDWNPITYEEALTTKNGTFAYGASKKFAEKAARDYVKEKHPQYDICTINPPFVLGPSIHPMNSMQSLSTPNKIFWNLINGSQIQPSLQHWKVDVRDLANAHVFALTNEELSNGRLLVAQGPFFSNHVCKMLREHFPEKTNTISKPSDVPFNENLYKLDNSLSKSLGLKYRSEEETYLDTALNLWERAKQFS
ncbi:flavonol reductase/cinnamoyl-CoA reductase family protein [Schizosaccharomyces octosporus yFS286]|uniref:Flavonol reductase/cinnamoyl-CoA reductase family protein n=1 Tax=Schizosaccharomyces octosporus (strain yFS286) TaxID=483514 RepID=S9R605_SCHOY|nr:flavonol reductase/cinnamoyl-CoA reductase family protein [Schizosaccharomyces octosporus yFS286]EPX73735.1 flavonol reductase/cinnamoyl-CoA reductase family protein [Schizosaccharomyces octosporus yFS286]